MADNCEEIKVSFLDIFFNFLEASSQIFPLNGMCFDFYKTVVI
jgi:hypothetical protein